LARQISAQIDTRSSKLEVLMKEADQKIALLQSLCHGQPTPSQSPDSPANSLPKSSATQQIEAPAVDPRHVQVYTLADQGRTPLEIAQQLNRPSGEIELILALRR
jgi:DNA-binding NarL/FixJ family response regulator